MTRGDDAPARPGDAARPLGDEVAQGTAHGQVYVRRLRRAQLGLALSALVAFGGLVGALPLLLALLPDLHGATVLGLPLPLVLVGVAPFPLFVAIALLFQRRADALDAEFRDLVDPE